MKRHVALVILGAWWIFAATAVVADEHDKPAAEVYRRLQARLADVELSDVREVPAEAGRLLHTGEAWLAFLAILIWHMYGVVFNPHVYPMNPSWITGNMPDDMYEHEHPGHLEEARRETERVIEKRIERMRRRNDEPNPLDEITSCKVDELKNDGGGNTEVDSDGEKP